MEYNYDKLCLETFLENQLQLYPEKVAETPEEADDFLDMCMAVVCKDKKDVKSYLREVGLDTADLDLSEMPEIFPLPDGRFLVVEV
ncbi:MAG: glyoxalase [Lachnospiraceae bacterium]|nr:glyoxalase [Lachnospiraceae bacterium]